MGGIVGKVWIMLIFLGRISITLLGLIRHTFNVYNRLVEIEIVIWA
jgi:hypothetical protein